MSLDQSMRAFLKDTKAKLEEANTFINYSLLTSTLFTKVWKVVCGVFCFLWISLL